MKNKIHFFTTLLCLLIGISMNQDQYFVGRIVYDLKFKNVQTGEDITPTLAPYLGSKQLYFIDTSNYKTYNQDEILTQLYNSKSNKYYFVNPTTQDVMEMDASETTSVLEKIEHIHEEEYVFGFKCKKLLLITDKDSTTYWYSTDFRVPVNNFIQHKYGHWAAYLEATDGALPIKFESKNSLYIMTSTAQSIDKIKFNEKSFDIKTMLR